MSDVVSNVLPLALGAAVSPIVLTLSVVTLSSKDRPRLRASLFALGTVTVLTVLGLLALSILSGLLSERTPGSNSVSGTISLTVGVVLLAVALYLHLRGPSTKDDKQPKESSQTNRRLVDNYLLGCFSMSTNFTTLMLYLPMLKELSRARIDEPDKYLVLMLCVLIIAIPAALPILMYQISPQRSEAILGKLNAFIARHSRSVTFALLLVFGVYLIYKGLSELL